MPADQVDALVIFGATGDLAKLETFPALVGLVGRGVLTVPIIGVAMSGWGPDQFKDYAVESLKLNGIDPASPAATAMLGLLRYIDGDLSNPATYTAMAAAMADSQRPQPVLGDVVALQPYPRGSWGPAHADALVPGGEAWHNPAS